MPSATPKDTDSAAGAEKKTAKKTTKKTTTAAKKKTVKKTAATGEKKTAKKTTTVAKKKTVKKAAEKAPKNTQRLRVRQVKSGIRHPWRMRRTLTALGLKHHQDEVVVPDNPSIRGMLQRVHHLISVTPEDTNG
jgi:ribosomal protein L30